MYGGRRWDGPAARRDIPAARHQTESSSRFHHTVRDTLAPAARTFREDTQRADDGGPAASAPRARWGLGGWYKSRLEDSRSDFEEWYQSVLAGVHLKTENGDNLFPIATEILPKKCARLKMRSEYEFKEKIPEQEIRDGKIYPITTPADRIFYINRALKERKGCQTEVGDIEREYEHCPEGVHVLERLPLSYGTYQKAYESMVQLFNDELRRPTYIPSPDGKSKSKNLNLLFLHKDPPIKFKKVIEYLYRNYNPLALLALVHGLAYVRFAGGGQADLEDCSLTLVRYNPGRGLVPHIDNVGDLQHTFGPIFTLAMGPVPDHPDDRLETKELDLLPTICQGDEPAVRISTEVFQSMMLQGRARSEYTHSVPFGIPYPRMTIAFKFPAIKRCTKPVAEFDCPVLQCKIPWIKV